MVTHNATRFFKVGPFDVQAVYLNRGLHAVQVTLPGTRESVPVKWSEISDAHLVAISKAVHQPLRGV